MLFNIRQTADECLDKSSTVIEDDNMEPRKPVPLVTLSYGECLITSVPKLSLTCGSLMRLLSGEKKEECNLKDCLNLAT